MTSLIVLYLETVFRVKHPHRGEDRRMVPFFPTSTSFCWSGTFKTVGRTFPREETERRERFWKAKKRIKGSLKRNDFLHPCLCAPRSTLVGMFFEEGPKAGDAQASVGRREIHKEKNRVGQTD